MSDEGLDNIFRKGLSERNVSFNMDSWRRMEEMLPPEPAAKGFRFTYAAAFIGVLLLLSTSLFVWNSQTESTGYIANNQVEGISKSNNDRNFVHESSHSTTSEGVGNSTALSSEEFDKNDNSSQNYISENNTNSAKSSESATYNAELSSDQMDALTSNTSANQGSSRSSSNSFFASTRTTGTGFFNEITHADMSEGNNDRQLAEEPVSFGNNAFTKIEGIGELAMLSIDDELDHTLVANVSDDGRPKVAKNVVGFIGGVNLNKSLVESPQNGIVGSEFFGAEYQRYLNGGFSLKTNLLYSARSGVNSQKVYDKKYYDFGSSSTQTSVECQRMIYVEVPVLLNYGTANHNFMVGPSFSYLVTGLNTVTTSYESLTGESYTDEQSEWGYTEGFKKYDFSIVAGYEYSLKSKLNVGVRLNYGLIDITDNEYFGNNSFDNNVQLRVYLTYSPFQF